MSQVPLLDSTTLVERFRRRLEDALAPIVAGKPCALVDFPDHTNVGDSAIWLGAVACLRTLGARTAYRCDQRSYDRAALARAVDEHGVIVINGGGNLGDIWRGPQQLREKVVQDFPDRQIVQLPQTVHFANHSALVRVARLFNAHPNLTLMLRDQRSLRIARSEFSATSLLAPDAAFCLGALARSSAPRTDVLWLRRDDREAAAVALMPDAANVEVGDWPTDEIRRWRRVRKMVRAWSGCRLAGAEAALYDAQARRRTDAGRQMLSRARVVVTDRLHAHILCLLLDIPHVILDNSYGKIREFFDTWTSSARGVRWADSPAEALAAARILLAERAPLR